MAQTFADNSLSYLEVAVLMETVNKYDRDNKCKFYLQALTPNKPKNLDESTTTNSGSNLANLNNNIGSTNITTSNVITLVLPREIARTYPTKWIPQGTRFIVSFIGGDITKPVIIGREYDGKDIQQS